MAGRSAPRGAYRCLNETEFAAKWYSALDTVVGEKIERLTMPRCPQTFKLPWASAVDFALLPPGFSRHNGKRENNRGEVAR